MAGHWSDQNIAATLNRMGLATGQGKTWTAHRVRSIRGVRDIHAYKSAEKGGLWLTLREDVVQVKYEMLRRVSVENTLVTDVSDQYGVSRPTIYQAKADFDEGGIAGLVPHKRGPHGPHKIQSKVLAFLIAQLSPGEPIRARELAKLVQKEFGIDVHPRMIERAVGGKKRRNDPRRDEAIDTFVRHRGAVRDAAFGHAWHVGMGPHPDARNPRPGAARSVFLVESDGAWRTPRRHSPARRYGNDDQ
jgi:transposase